MSLPVAGTGRTIRAAREARSWTLEDLAKHARVPAATLGSLEAERWSELPAGPYVEAWTRSCCEVLELPEPQMAPDARPEPKVPLQWVRWIALASVFAVLGTLAWLQVRELDLGATEPVGPPVEDQFVRLVTRGNTRVRVELDGEVVVDGILPGGTDRTFEAFDEIILQVPSVEVVRIYYNDVRIVPQGRQDSPRRLVFIDDEGR